MTEIFYSSFLAPLRPSEVSSLCSKETVTTTGAGGGGGIGITYPQSQSSCGTHVLHACVSRNRCQPSTNFFVT